jgi:hypothetical protein
MTTEVPQYPGQPPYPTATYPTAPPWAAAPTEAPAPRYGEVAPYGSPLPQHGQLLVPYPEEMHNAARPKAPAVWPVALLTFLFLIPGIVSAARRATRARRGRNSAAPYWITFAVSVVVSWFVWSIAVAAAVPAFLAGYENAVTHRVESAIVHDGQVAKSAGMTVRTVTCDPSGPRALDGRRPYVCLLTLDGAGTGTLNVVADRDGRWTAVIPAK